MLVSIQPGLSQIFVDGSKWSEILSLHDWAIPDNRHTPLWRKKFMFITLNTN